MSEADTYKREELEKKKEEEKGLPKKKTHKVQEEEVENKAGESKRGYQAQRHYYLLNSTTLQQARARERERERLSKDNQTTRKSNQKE